MMPLTAAEVLGIWQHGPGQVADAAAQVGSEIPAGTVFTAGDELVRVTLLKAPQSSLLLAPNSKAFLVEEGDSIVVHLEAGTLQANINDKGLYHDLHVVGAALDVRVTGTLFVVERVKADTDYVALVEGKVKVNLRKEVALALNQQDGGVELLAHQGLGGSVGGGLGSIEALAARPQVTTTSVLRANSVQEQAVHGSGGWSEDQAMAAVTSQESVTNTVNENVRQVVTEQVSQQVSQQVSEQVTNTVVQEVVGGAAPLAAPPAPPAR
jgi:hypothetical protein